MKRKVAPVDVPLTPKQRAFVEWYCSAEVNMVGSEAAKRAGYNGNANVLRVIANRNLGKPNVKAAVEARLAKALKGAEITVESIMRRLTLLGEEARGQLQYASAVRCAELQGKYLKMFTDRIEHVGSIEDVSTDQLGALLSELAERGGIDLSRLLAGNARGERGLSDPPGAQKAH